jgi:lipopolysaccharide export system permease protein
MAFVLYFNLLLLGKSWIENGQIPAGIYLVALHGGACALSILWLLKRHFNWVLRRPARSRRGATQKEVAP